MTRQGFAYPTASPTPAATRKYRRVGRRPTRCPTTRASRRRGSTQRSGRRSRRRRPDPDPGSSLLAGRCRREAGVRLVGRSASGPETAQCLRSRNRQCLGSRHVLSRQCHPGEGAASSNFQLKRCFALRRSVRNSRNASSYAYSPSVQGAPHGADNSVSYPAIRSRSTSANAGLSPARCNGPVSCTRSRV